MSDAEDNLHDDDYYPLRWKVADFFEDLFVLHRAAVVGVLALLGAGFILLGFLVLNGSSNPTDTAAEVAGTEEVVDDTTTSSQSPTTIEDNDGDADADTDAAEEAARATTEPSTTAPTTSSSTTTTSTTTTTSSSTTTTTTTTTAAPESSRSPASEAELAATSSGRIGVISPSQIVLTGGLPTDAAANEVVAFAEEFFPDFAIVDEQIVDESFTDFGSIRLRLSGADLFAYRSDNLNDIHLPAVDQLAASLVANEEWVVEVSGHTDDTGPADGNQRLSNNRAASAAARLVSQGVAQARVTSIGLGEDAPIADNGTDSGRLENRRVEFTLSS